MGWWMGEIEGEWLMVDGEGTWGMERESQECFSHLFEGDAFENAFPLSRIVAVPPFVLIDELDGTARAEFFD